MQQFLTLASFRDCFIILIPRNGCFCYISFILFRFCYLLLVREPPLLERDDEPLRPLERDVLLFVRLLERDVLDVRLLLDILLLLDFPDEVEREYGTEYSDEVDSDELLVVVDLYTGA